MSPRPRVRRAFAACLVLAALAACSKAPPISIGQRESAVGQGLVITVTNTSDEFLHDVVLDIVSPAGEQKRFSMPTLAPHETVNVGWLKLDGWPIPAGSEVTVGCKDHRKSRPFRLSP